MIEVIKYVSPIGPLHIAKRKGKITALIFDGGLEWLSQHHHGENLSPSEDSQLAGALDRYFGGTIDALDQLEVEFSGTEFQNKVWRGLRRIPPGKTTSYSEMARKIGHPAAVRAVGTAAGKNPVGIIVPCHRMVRSDGSLGGYAGGLDKKEWLLAHERRQEVSR